MKRGLVKLKTMAIVHGQSEYYLCASIKSNLRIKHEIISRNRGKSCIQVTSVMDILKDSRFCKYRSFKRCFCDVDKTLNDFSLFIIMDVDDCTQEQKDNFINKRMFAKHWLYEHIIPIYNIPNLEETMEQAKVIVEKKKDYIKIFPTNHGDLDIEKAKAFLKKLKQCQCSNLSQYIQHCLDITAVTHKTF